VGFVLLMLAALGKAGAIPFHTWIPDAAKNAPTPFMALIPGSLEKLLGIYLAVRVTRDFYVLEPGSVMSLLIMGLGVLTIVVAVAMALIQKDMKRLLSYHAISQVGYMALGIGTALPVGMAGALFHMLNHSVYKSALFLSAGVVERGCGSTDLRQIGGLRHLMPLTTIGFLVAAFSISGLPPFNGFFSKELIYEAALESGLAFYVLALLGAFMTAASFLKLGHAIFYGPLKYPQEGDDAPLPREAPAAMFLPLLVLALLCLLLGLFNALPLSVIQVDILGEYMAGHDYSGWPHSIGLVIVSLVALIVALLDHIFGMLSSGEAVKALDHIRYAPGLRNIYNAAEKRYFDPYEWLMFGIKAYTRAFFALDRAIDWVYSVLLVKLIGGISTGLSALNDGHSVRHMVWALTGMLFLLMTFLIMM
jgi:NADH-quinone oxidoreductase subunit L